MGLVRKGMLTGMFIKVYRRIIYKMEMGSIAGVMGMSILVSGKTG